MNIQRLELLAVDLPAQRDYYANVLELPAQRTAEGLLVRVGSSEILFKEANSGFDGAYHFAFNIPENKFQAAKAWISKRAPIMRDKNGAEEFYFQSWNSDSVYFPDAAGNVVEFIARHGLQNAAQEDFDSRYILNVSEIGLPTQDVIGLANEICTRLGISVYKQQPNESFTPLGDEEGLLILPNEGRIWMPDSGVPARRLPVKVWGTANRKNWEIRGVPYEILA